MYVCHLPPTHPATCSAQKSAASSSCILRCMLRRQLEVRSDGVELSAHQLQLLVVLADELKGRRGEAGCRSWGERRGADVGARRGWKACGGGGRARRTLTTSGSSLRGSSFFWTSVSFWSRMNSGTESVPFPCGSYLPRKRRAEEKWAGRAPRAAPVCAGPRRRLTCASARSPSCRCLCGGRPPSASSPGTRAARARRSCRRRRCR